MSISRTHLLMTFACLLSAGNVVLYQLLSARFSSMEAAITVLANHSASTAADRGDTTTLAETSPSSPGAASLRTTYRPGVLAQKIKQQKAQSDPVTEAADMDRRMAQEPSIPGIEQTQTRLLQKAIAAMPADAPHALGVQTRCQGRRCLISADFADDAQANDWASRLLLTGGRNLPRSARVVAVPLEGGNGATGLQLYLF